MKSFRVLDDRLEVDKFEEKKLVRLPYTGPLFIHLFVRDADVQVHHRIS